MDVVTVDHATGLAIASFAVAAVLCLLLTPLAARIAWRLGLVDHPGGRRLHVADVPLGGGLALLVSIVVPVALIAPRLGSRYWAILIAAGACVVLGLLDDRFQLGPAVKLVGEIAIATIPVAAGITINHFTAPLLDPVTLGWFAYPVTVIWIVALMNVVNFIDGMDGLAAGFGVIAGSTFAILSLSLGRGVPAVVAAALAGACLGFLRFNFHPARVFMGDAGALTIGFLLAAISVQGVLKTTAAVAVAFPLLVLFVPLLDTSFVVLKRLKYRRPVWQADENHLHHRFRDVGFGQRRAALLLYLWCSLLAAFALAVRFVHYRPHGHWHLGATLFLGAFALLALACTVYVVYVLEILKQRHLQLLGLGRGSDVPGETPLVVARRERRERVALEP
jgi:UDP-GlcNAc:undecaprenyl-phosphate GlcNAc-1-phosphate transferase